MKSYIVGVFFTLCAAIAFAPTSVIGQSVPDTVAGHVAAAKAAGGELWPSLVKSLCASAEQAPAPTPPQAQPPNQGPPPRSQWYREPSKVFDNMYIFSMSGVAAWAVNTSGGVILIDALYDYSVKDEVDAGMRTLGLDPGKIKAVFITHGHGDHSGGAKYLQELYSPRVFLSAADWDLLARPPANPNANPQPVPKKDGIVTDGMKYTLGDTTITVYITPGHTPGTLAFLIPVKINGTPHVAAFWGGTAISRNTGVANLTTYSASAKRFEDIVMQAKADILLSNHDGFGEYFKRIAAMKANPSAPNPFVVGNDGVRRYLQVLQHCSQAIVVAMR